ncbi:MULTISPECIES: HD domain-containing phosphohydrolase [Vibrio]|uniref:HD domain-containing phosphohydrolase n=1 Tax=Vibrio TaxID=662 RepID=UPI00051CFE70|nr:MULTISPECIES: HD domain-containing phosphohydrolase [Vibrio]EJL6400125.1 response regulator [Vibrio navarrensis]EJL6565825.1 response regulator [Vibrio navarrensis]KGK13865.1 chemotaxis protein CheY [Vibrio navarrensis]MBG0759850.1 two-component system response regulator [Vibrio cidicii]MBH9738585.1 two-component system response regulator [Vibrio navarrensis]
MSLLAKPTPRILIVDDEPANLKVMRQVLQENYRLSFARSGQDALALLAQEKVDLILLDIMMPEMTGFDVCQRLKSNPKTAAIPVIFVTALRDSIDEETGFALGGVDYITKPIVPAIVRARVKTHLSLVNIDALREVQIDLIQRLGRAAEYKDNETGMHVQRMSHYSKILAMAAGIDEERADELRMAATMHDIGKIAIPDNILLKPGKLDEREFSHMKKHAEIGASILAEPRSALVALARSIAITHHEKWDGSGYPNGLAGEAIPLEGRIAAITDVFDALTSERPYKKAWPIEEAIEFVQAQSGKHFDPQLVRLFIEQLPKILEIKEKFKEESFQR